MESSSRPFSSASSNGSGAMATKRAPQGHNRQPPAKRRRTIQEPTYYHAPIRSDTTYYYMLPNNTTGACIFISALSSISNFINQVQYISAMVELIAAIMIKNVSDANLQICGIRALTECGPSMAIDANRYRCVDTITGAMEEHREELLVQIEGFRALRRWMRTDKAVLSVLGERDRLSIILEAMNHHSGSCQMRYIGLDILWTLACFSAEQRINIANQPKCISSVVRLLEKNLRDCCVQQIGLSLLSWIVEEKNSRDVVIQEGGALHVLRAMQAHPDEQMVQCNGAATLCWLVHTAGSSTSAALASNTEGIATILQAMNRYIGNPMIFGNIACVLSGALVADPSREDLGHTETARLAILGMQLHDRSPKVHRNCLTLLRLLTTTTTTTSTSTVENHSLVLRNADSIETAMRLYSNDAGIQAEACGLLANLCSTPEAKAELSKSGCMEAVVQCQLEHRGNARVQHAALWFHSYFLHHENENLDNDTTTTIAAFGGGLDVLDSMIAGGVTMQQQQQQGQDQA
jgi:hypothetical protein